MTIPLITGPVRGDDVNKLIVAVNGIAAQGVGNGDVVGPASATDNHIAAFNGATGKLIKDGGVLGTMAAAATSSYTATSGLVALLIADAITNGVVDKAPTENAVFDALALKQAALSGAVLTAVTVQGTDKILIQDVSDTDNLKTVTAQSIADLSTGQGPTGSGTVSGLAGVAVTEETGNKLAHYTLLTLTNVVVVLADDVGVGAYGSAFLYTLPKGYKQIQTKRNLVITKTSAGVDADWEGQSVITDVVLTNAAIASSLTDTAALGPATAGSQTDIHLSGNAAGAITAITADMTTTSGNPSTLYFGVTVNDADQDVTGTPCNFILNGTIQIRTIDSGDI